MPRKSRNTRQKEIIKKEIEKFSSFFTAEELYGKAKKSDKSIGVATVYRFLKHLAENHGIHSYNCNRKIIYSNSKRSHSHFICEKCGKISHIEVSSIDFIKNKIKGDVCHFQIDVYGVCENCAN